MSTETTREDRETENVHSAAPLDKTVADKAGVVKPEDADAVADAIEEQGTAHVPLGA